MIYICTVHKIDNEFSSFLRVISKWKYFHTDLKYVHLSVLHNAFNMRKCSGGLKNIFMFSRYTGSGFHRLFYIEKFPLGNGTEKCFRLGRFGPA